MTGTGTFESPPENECCRRHIAVERSGLGRFLVPPDNAGSFESFKRSREYSDIDIESFVASTRDAQTGTFPQNKKEWMEKALNFVLSRNDLAQPMDLERASKKILDCLDVAHMCSGASKDSRKALIQSYKEAKRLSDLWESNTGKDGRSLFFPRLVAADTKPDDLYEKLVEKPLNFFEKVGNLSCSDKTTQATSGTCETDSPSPAPA